METSVYVKHIIIHTTPLNHRIRTLYIYTSKYSTIVIIYHQGDGNIEEGRGKRPSVTDIPYHPVALLLLVVGWFIVLHYFHVRCVRSNYSTLYVVFHNICMPSNTVHLWRPVSCPVYLWRLWRQWRPCVRHLQRSDGQ
jgi:hypothetical protein